MTWMRKSTATMVPRDVRLKKLQLVIDEQPTMQIKPDNSTFLVKRKLQEHYALLNHEYPALPQIVFELSFCRPE